MTLLQLHTTRADAGCRYAQGLTPNPDLACNRAIKFDVLLRHAEALGAEALVTGHYARLRHAPGAYCSLLFISEGCWRCAKAVAEAPLTGHYARLRHAPGAALSHLCSLHETGAVMPMLQLRPWRPATTPTCTMCQVPVPLCLYQEAAGAMHMLQPRPW